MSPIAFILMILLFTALGFSLWRSGGRAFSPGPLSVQGAAGIELGGFDSHADFETECERCHQPYETIQGNLCVECHTEIAGQIEVSEGAHASIEGVGQCFRCHSDHRGREFDMLAEAYAKFEHTLTGFSLLWHQLDFDTSAMRCTACHLADGSLTFEAESCESCHAGHAPDFMAAHLQDFGGNCLGCHDGVDRMMEFDHSTTAFMLEGRHAEVQCRACHGDEVPAETPQACRGCHAEPSAHQGVFGLDCETCHEPQSWVPALLDGALFDHSQQSTFSLVRHATGYAGEALTCHRCHEDDLQSLNLATCVTCHDAADPVFMQSHRQQFGPDCLECHDGVDRLSDFDHANFFPLTGRHAEATCEDCHAGRRFRGTPEECVACHAEPEIHAAFFGLKCQYCHDAEAWAPAPLRAHPFPLDHGGRGESECLACHLGPYDAFTCYECHEHQPEEILASHIAGGIAEAQIPDCMACHPTGVETTLEGKRGEEG